MHLFVRDLQAQCTVDDSLQRRTYGWTGAHHLPTMQLDAWRLNYTRGMSFEIFVFLHQWRSPHTYSEFMC